MTTLDPVDNYVVLINTFTASTSRTMRSGAAGRTSTR